MSEDKGLRFNEGKIRFDLTHPVGNKGVARVMTKGAKKYAERNWEGGMKWSKVIASAHRHLAAIEAGEDYDIDPKCEACNQGTPGGDVNDWKCTVHTGELHADLLQTNAHFLSSYYKIYPQGDDRLHRYLETKRIGLDIDDVLAEWVVPFTELVGAPIPESWYFGFPEYVKGLMDKGFDYFQFMKNLPVKTKPQDIPFEPTCYITNRSNPDIPVQIAEQWIKANGFPQVKVIQTTDKIEAAKEMKLDIFVDDKFETFVAMNNAGILCYLFDAPHNRKHDVGFKRIKSLKDIPL
jgi:hypothetical protein